MMLRTTSSSAATMMSLVSFLLSLLLVRTNAFTIIQGNPAVISRHSSRLFASSNNKDKESGETEDASSSIEAARRQLESLMGSTSSSSGGSSSSTSTTKSHWKDTEKFLNAILSSSSSSSLLDRNKKDPVIPPLPPPPAIRMTSMERDRRLAEIQALLKLKESDESVATLWELWFSERGADAKERLEKADRLMGDPTSWKQCENELKQLILDYGIYFVEPVNRLATLYYLQGRHEQSYKLCVVILELKPWHFGALSGIVSVCVNLGNQEQARSWAMKRMPSLIAGSSAAPFAGGSVNPQRAEWIDRMVANARESLAQAEQQTKESFFGKPEEYYKQRKSTSSVPEDEMKEESDAWQ